MKLWTRLVLHHPTPPIPLPLFRSILFEVLLIPQAISPPTKTPASKASWVESSYHVLGMGPCEVWPRYDVSVKLWHLCSGKPVMLLSLVQSKKRPYTTVPVHSSQKSGAHLSLHHSDFFFWRFSSQQITQKWYTKQKCDFTLPVSPSIIQSKLVSQSQLRPRSSIEYLPRCS